VLPLKVQNLIKHTGNAQIQEYEFSTRNGIWVLTRYIYQILNYETRTLLVNCHKSNISLNNNCLGVQIMIIKIPEH
jgi:hypothetical protein